MTCKGCKNEFSGHTANNRKSYYCSHKCFMENKSLPKSAFKKGYTPWNKGKKCPQLSGENCAMWKGGITNNNKLDRVKFQQTIQKEVLKRDNYTCQMCGIRGVVLQVDHIQSWKDYVELRFSMDNCRTLCQECHYKITFGKEMPKEVKTWGHNFKFFERKVD